MQNLTLKQIVIRNTVIISLTELGVMLILNILPFDFNVFTEALIDVVILVTIASPLIYIWVIKPSVISRDKALRQLKNMAYSDQLTELPNRRFLLEYIEKFIAESVRHQFYGALILIDLDDFKLINDNHGHAAGDAVLIEVARRLKSHLRAEDVASRVGGDEFIILLNRLNGDAKLAGNEAIKLAEKLRKLLSEPINFKNMELYIGSSFGIRLLGVEHIGVDAAIREADCAMYQAKQSGKGCIIMFAEE
jgi:diguanylate cyclase (GGDEF)-like protein